MTDNITYYDLFHKTLRILDSNVEEDGEDIYEDRFSHSSGHYTVTTGYAKWAWGDATCRVLVRLDDLCNEEMEEFDPESPAFLFNVAEELAISPSGNGDPNEDLVNILKDRGYGGVEFSNFRIMKVRKLSINHYLVQFNVEFLSNS